MLLFGIRGQFLAFPIQVGIFRVGLGTDGNVITLDHGHRARHQPSGTSNQNAAAIIASAAATPTIRLAVENNPVVGPEDCGAELAYELSAVLLRMFH